MTPKEKQSKMSKLHKVLEDDMCLKKNNQGRRNRDARDAAVCNKVREGLCKKVM